MGAHVRAHASSCLSLGCGGELVGGPGVLRTPLRSPFLQQGPGGAAPSSTRRAGLPLFLPQLSMTLCTLLLLTCAVFAAKAIIRGEITIGK